MLNRALTTIAACLITLISLITLAATDVLQLSPTALAMSLVAFPAPVAWFVWILANPMSPREEWLESLYSRHDVLSRIAKITLISACVGLLGVIPFSALSPILGIFIWLPIWALLGIPIGVACSVGVATADSVRVICLALALDFALASAYYLFGVEHSFFISGAYGAVAIMGAINIVGVAAILHFARGRLVNPGQTMLGVLMLCCAIAWFIASIYRLRS